MKTIKTTLHHYRFDISNTEQKKQYNALCEKLKAMGLKVFASISYDHSDFYNKQIAPLDGKEITLEINHLFKNQWNTTPIGNDKNGLRVFDWSEPIYPNKKIKQGMWLEQTLEMTEVRENTCECGYCGKNYYKPDQEFCSACLDSEYLTEGQLPLLKLLPISKEDKRIGNVVVPDSLVVAFKNAQTYANDVTRPAKELKRSQKDLQDTISEMSNKAAAFKRLEGIAQWLLDHNINTSNFIFYDHSQTICIGWRKPLTKDEISTWKKTFSDNNFPVIWSDMIEYKKA